MSIATRIQAMSNHIRADYIAIRRLGVDIENIEKNIENIASLIDTAYANLPKVTGEGSNISLSPTREGGLSIIPKGACEQDSYSGKNILGLPNITKTSFGVTATNVDDVITIRGTGTNVPTLDFTLPQDIVMDGDYNVLVEFEGTKNLTTFQVLFRNSSGSNMFVNRLENTNKINTIQTRSNEALHYIRIYLNNGATINGTIKIMLTKSSTLDDVFEKYVGGLPSPSPDFPQSVRVVTGDNSVVVQNENLLKFYRTNDDSQYGTFENETYTSNSRLSNSVWVFKKEILNNEEFVTSYNSISNAELKYLLYDTDATTSAEIIALISNSSYALNVTNGGIIRNSSNKKYLYISFRTTTTGTTASVEKLQLEYGSTATEYVAHEEQVLPLRLGNEYLAGIGDYKDEIVGKTDDWKIRRYVGSEIFDGTNVGFTVNGRIVEGSYTTVNRSRSYYKKLDNNNQYGCMCNKMKSANINQTYAGQINSIALGGNGNYVQACFNYSVGTNYQEINTWLQSNNLKVYYLLATPTEEIITNQTLITDLNNMYQAMGYDGTINITITSNPNNAQMTASVSALKGE